MKKVRHLNIRQLVSINSVPPQRNYNWKWFDAKNTFWKKRKAGFYNIFSVRGPASFSQYLSEEDVKDGALGRDVIIENKKIYNLPYVELCFSSGESVIREFDDYYTACKHAEKQASHHIPEKDRMTVVEKPTTKN